MKLIIPILIFNILWAGTITPELRVKMEKSQPGEYIDVVVYIAQRVDLNSLGKGRYKEKMALLKETADRSQKSVITFIQNHPEAIKEYRTFWLNNSISVRARRAVIEALANLPEVDYVDIEPVLTIPDWKVNKADMIGVRTPSWNISKIKADSAWNYYTGNNIIIGFIDSGFEPTHPALQNKWSGWWYDAVNHNNYPYDDYGHGTPVAGIICGGDGNGPFTYDIGVAPGAKLAAAKVVDITGGITYVRIMESFEWFYAIKADSGADVKVISNSWSGPQGDMSFWYVILNLRAIDIIPVFSIGNAGPAGPLSPGDYPTVIGVGATDINDDVPYWSSRGPTLNIYPYTAPIYWPREDWNRIKPNISAPGDSVLSSYLNGQYAWCSGTSFSAPAIAGVLALLMEKNPYLNTDFTWTYSMVLDYADKPQQGEPFPNNDYGWGRTNALNSVLYSPSISDPYLRITGKIITDNPPGGNGNAWPEPGETVDMKVTLKNLGANVVNVVAFLSVLDTGITIQDNFSSYGNMPRGSISEGDGFRFSIAPLWPSGLKARFVLTAYGNNANYTFVDTFEVILGFPHFSGPDPYGYYALDNEYDTLYYANAPRFNWIELQNLGTALYLSDDGYQQIALPFTFKYYNQNFNQIYICANGLLSFLEGSNDASNSKIPDIDGPSAMVAPLWDDLNPANPQRPIWYYYNPSDHIFIIEYDSIAHYGYPSVREKFEVILYDPAYHQTPTGDGEIVLQYLLEPLQTDYTTGIENPMEIYGIQYFYNDTLDPYGQWIKNGSAIKFTTKIEGLGISEGPRSEYVHPIPLKITGPTIIGQKGTGVSLTVFTSTPLKVDISMFDITGRLIGRFLAGERIFGEHKIHLPGNLSGGTYFIVARSESMTVKKKIIYIK